MTQDKSTICGSSSVGRATAFQAVGRGFEPRLPLYLESGLFSVESNNEIHYADVAQG